MADLRQQLRIPAEEEFPGFAPGTPEAGYIAARLEAWNRQSERRSAAIHGAVVPIPDDLGSDYRGTLSTQQALGSILVGLSRIPELAERIVTVSPDVASSTNLGGWINKMKVYRHRESPNFFRQHAIPQMLNWEEGPQGHHVELGISENSFFSLLSMLGLAKEFTGEILLPIGTIYDPFICRGLDALIYGAYSQSKFIFAGTPSGITLSPEGGAHQSLLSPSIGMQLPDVVSFEPAFAQELEWILLAGFRNLLDREHGQIVYLRLSTRPVNQAPFLERASKATLETLRESVLRGGYRIVCRQSDPGYCPGVNVVNIFASGVMVANAIEAACRLHQDGVFTNVINVTSADLLYRGWKRATELSRGIPVARTSFHLERLIPAAERVAPIVTVMDGHSQTLAFLGGIFGTRVVALGVDAFGQSGTRNELYEHYGVSTGAIEIACKAALHPTDHRQPD